MKTANTALVALLNGQRKAVKFNGATGNITINHNASLAFGGSSFSIEGWVTHVAGQDNRYLANKGASGGVNGFRWGVTSNKPYILVGDATDFIETTIGSTNLPVTAAHLAVVVDRTAGQAIGYINGANIGSANISSVANSIVTSANMIVGGTGVYSAGQLDELRIYARKLSDSDVAAHAIGQFQDESSLRLWLTFDEGLGTTVFDLSGNGNDGTLIGSPLSTFVDSNPYPGMEKQFRVADFLTITLSGGGVLRYTSSDTDVTYNGNVYLTARSGVAPLFKRSHTRTVIGVEVDTMELEIMPDSTHLISGQQMLQAAVEGVFDGAQVLVERAFMPRWGSAAAGTVIMFSGRVADLEARRTSILIQVKSDLELLNTMIPIELYQPGCLHTLYDSGCALSKANFACSSTASNGSTRSAITCSLAEVNGYFDKGIIAFSNGPNSGVSRTVKLHTSGLLTTIVPFPSIPGVGDAFTAYPGCDKQQTTCGIFSNITVTRSSNTLVATAHGLQNDEAAQLATTGNLPAPLIAGRYFVVNSNANNFQVANLPRGAPITLTDAGTGTHRVSQHGKFANLDNFKGFPYIPVPETLL